MSVIKIIFHLLIFLTKLKNNDDGSLYVSSDGIHIHDNGNNKLYSLIDNLLSNTCNV